MRAPRVVSSFLTLRGQRDLITSRDEDVGIVEDGTSREECKRQSTPTADDKHVPSVAKPKSTHACPRPRSHTHTRTSRRIHHHSPPLLDSTGIGGGGGSSSSSSNTTTVNTLHVKLFHHFETTTRHTLCFGSVWEEAIRWSLENETLMHAMLCVSARHLAYLFPDDPTYSLAARAHLVQSLGMFRRDIDNNKTLTASDADAFMATSILIYFELWTETEFVIQKGSTRDGREARDALDLSRDNMIPLARGLVELFLRSGPVLFDRGNGNEDPGNPKPSVFVAEIQHSPRRNLENAAAIHQGSGLRKGVAVDSIRSWSVPATASGPEQVSDDSDRKSQDEMDNENDTVPLPPPPNPAQTPAPSAHEKGYGHEKPGEDEDAVAESCTFQSLHEDATSRLATLCMFLPEMRSGPHRDRDEERLSNHETERDHDGFPLLPPRQLRADLIRYAFTFPILTHEYLSRLVSRRRDDTLTEPGLVVLYHFYRCVRILLGDDSHAWWTHRRARSMESLLEQQLRETLNVDR
ncbi:hypothetical protein LTS17_004696 [Exophiala oligosperma]